ncbi:ABC transporter permease [Rhizomonospora bruguierae]|uniref:ABC transporter permease n=1 Tax=Rhizomonospora bruguierae TaxID=1581705 RepID=UPI0020BE107C|nr:ABC transporter permease [Micromonospora sp. NBRC 107566]
MGTGAVTVGAPLGVALGLLIAVAVVVSLVARLGVGRGVATAAGRAVAQLALVSLLIASVLRWWWATALFIAAMLLVAAGTSARRVRAARGAWWVAAAIGAGSVPTTAIVLVTGPVPRSTVAVLPIAGIIIGGAMTATSLAGRRALDELRTRHGEYEAALALGFTDREAVLEVCRPTVAQALVPALDQTRTVGLVTLPGAFVGVLLGGGSAVQAGATQLLVLVALLAAEAVAVAVVVELVAAGRITHRR